MTHDTAAIAISIVIYALIGAYSLLTLRMVRK